MNYKDFLEEQLKLSEIAAKSIAPEDDILALYQYMRDLKKRITSKTAEQSLDFIKGGWYRLSETVNWGREWEFYQFIGMCQETNCSIKDGEMYIFRLAGETLDYGDVCSYNCYSNSSVNCLEFLKALKPTSLTPDFENAQAGDYCFNPIIGETRIIQIIKGENPYIVVEAESKDVISKMTFDSNGFKDSYKNHPVLFNSVYQFKAYWAEQFKTDDSNGTF